MTKLWLWTQKVIIPKILFSRGRRCAYTPLTREIWRNCNIICVLHVKTDNENYTRLSKMEIDDLTIQRRTSHHDSLLGSSTRQIFHLAFWISRAARSLYLPQHKRRTLILSGARRRSRFSQGDLIIAQLARGPASSSHNSVSHVIHLSCVLARRIQLQWQQNSLRPLRRLSQIFVMRETHISVVAY